ncbi:MAG: tripartite tricarboxylate transporter TctB family protein [Pikeienuella sp.]
MTARARTRLLALGTVALALALLSVVIPEGVVVGPGLPWILRGDLWPTVIASCLLAAGAGLGLATYLADPAPEPGDDATQAASAPGLMRLVGLGAVLLGLAFGVGTFGMVWTSLLGFWAIALLIRARPLWVALLVGALLPLLLYGFFSHFAGVPIPQGIFIRLP